MVERNAMNARVLIIGIMLLFSLSVAQASNLTVTNLDVSVSYPPPYDRFSDRDDTDDDIVNGTAIKADIYPGSLVEFTFDVGNEFPSAGDVDIQNILATVTVVDLEESGDVEEEYSEFDLEPGAEEHVRIPVNVPEKVEAKDYDVTIHLEGETDNTTERVKILLKMSVRKESHDLKIISYSISPGQVTCDRSIVVKGTLANLGRNEESDAAVEVRSDAIGLYQKQEGIFLNEDPFEDDNEYAVAVPYAIPKTQKAGTYAISIRALFKGTTQMDLRQVNVKVIDCPASPSPTPEEEKPAEQQNQSQQAEQPVISPPPQGQQPGQNGDAVPPVYSSVERPFFSTPLGIAAIIIGNIVLVGVLIFIGAKLIVGKGGSGNARNEWGGEEG